MLILNHVHHSARYGYLYVDTPKVACSTIKHTLECAERGGQSLPSDTDDGAPGRYGYSNMLLGIHDRQKSRLMHPRDPDQLPRLRESGCFVFCFVRNPYTRVLSAYLDKIAKSAERRALFREVLGKPGDELMSFLEFLELVERQLPEAMDPHWRPQHVHLHGGRLTYDYIGSLEQFQQDFVRVLASVSPALMKYAVTVDEHRTNASALVRFYYADTRAVELVARIYKQDFEMFGYPTNIALSAEPPHVHGPMPYRYPPRPGSADFAD